ncbi:unnamed protein product [Jaminaea pallidilutea]
MRFSSFTSWPILFFVLVASLLSKATDAEPQPKNLHPSFDGQTGSGITGRFAERAEQRASALVHPHPHPSNHHQHHEPYASSLESNETFRGEGTFFEPGVNFCGGTHSTSQDMVVAASELLYAQYPGGGHNTHSPLCGRKANITTADGSKSVQATIVDQCPADECSVGSLDMSPAVFSRLSSLSVGRIRDLRWTFIEDVDDKDSEHAHPAHSNHPVHPTHPQAHVHPLGQSSDKQHALQQPGRHGRLQGFRLGHSQSSRRRSSRSGQ